MHEAVKPTRRRRASATAPDLRVGGAGKLFKLGQAPIVRATFDDWWKNAGYLTLEYRVRDREQILAQTETPYTRLAVTAAASPQQPRPEPAEPRGRGFYEVEAFLRRSGQRVSGTCTTYTVAASGHGLDLDSCRAGRRRRPGPDPWRGPRRHPGHGPAPGRPQLGRAAAGRCQLLGTPRLRPPGRLFGDVAGESARRGIPFIVMLGHGGIEKFLSRTARGRHASARSCSTTAARSQYWEAWNESNVSFGPADAYANKILKPAYRSMKAADPAAKMIGPSSWAAT